MTSRKRLFLAVVAIAVAFGVGGYLLGQQLESPEEARAVVAAPEASLIAVPVESVALSNDVVVRGDAEYEGAVDIVLDPTLGDGTSRVVTGRVPDVDTLVDEGAVLIEVSGRPVFVLKGDLPAFREFKPGLEGDDVLQLEESLSRLGYLDVPPDRLYGDATERALEAMYEAVGYEARAASDGEEDALDAARDAVENARKNLADANDGLADANKPESLASQVASRQTRQALVDAIADADEALDDARDSTPSLELQNAINFVSDLIGSGAPSSDLLAAEQRVTLARAADMALIEGAEDALARARAELVDYDEREAAADADVLDTSSLQTQVSRAGENLADLEADLADLEADIGVRLPIAEVVFLPELPRTITEVDVERGDLVPATGPVMRISGTDVRITVGVSEANRPLLELGQRVIIDQESLGLGPYEGEITELADRTGTKGAADTRYHMVVTPQGEYSVTEVVGINFRIQIPIERTEGEVLAVPLAALSAGADGSARVELLTGDNESELVEVEVGLSDKNRSLVEIAPLSRDLEAGDLVVIGIEQSFDAPADSDADEAEPEDEGGS